MKISEVNSIPNASTQIDRRLDGTRECIVTREELKKIVEIPCLKATLVLYDKNIRTTSTDANKERIGSNGHIRIKISSLSEENKKLLKELYPNEYEKSLAEGVDVFNFEVPIHEESTVEDVSQMFMDLLPNFAIQDVLYGHKSLKDFAGWLIKMGNVDFEDEIPYEQQVEETVEMLKKDGILEQLVDAKILTGVEYIDAETETFWETKELYDKHMQYIMRMQEKNMPNLTKIALNLASYLYSLNPQTKDGSLQYYFSGSLATMILANAMSITEMNLDESNNIGGETFSKDITEEQRIKIGKFSRKLGRDIDVVNVNGSLYRGAPIDNKPHAQNTIQHVPQILSLMSKWKLTTSGYYIDDLDFDREITHHPVVKVKTENGDMYVTAPPELIAHKLSETIFCISQIESSSVKPENRKEIESKYEKDIKDLSSMFYGFKDLYDKDEFLTRVYTALEEKKGRAALFTTSQYDTENKNQGYLTKMVERIMVDCGAYLDEIADNQSSMEIKKFLADLLSRRKTEVEKQKHTGKTPLQQKEEELSLLEAEARKISETEALIDQQKEGHDMGDE